MVEYWQRDSEVQRSARHESTRSGPYALHSKIPGYKPTPLLSLPEVAHELRIGSVLVKYEHDRFGLPSFKPLGATWGVYQWMNSHVEGGLEGRWSTFDELRSLVDTVGGMTLVTATDGNHGRAVAFAAKLFGLRARILIPKGTSASRINAIASEGARVDVVDGNYDDAVRVAAAMADESHLVVSDTSWPDYEKIPQWIAEGYETLFDEIDHDMGLGNSPDVLLVPVGVGALAEAALRHFASEEHDVKIVAVEPVDAACVLASLREGKRVTVGGIHRSMMVGLNCGTPSMVAWPIMRDGLDAAVAIDDDYMKVALRKYNENGIQVGETGAATLGALMAMCDRGDSALADHLGLTEQSTVVLLATESITDQVNFERIVNGT